MSRGKRSTVTDPTGWPAQLAAVDQATDQAGDADETETKQPVEQPQDPVQAVEPVDQSERPEVLDLEVVRLGQRVRKFRTHADPNNSEELLQLLLDAVRRTGGKQTEIRDYELVVRYVGERGEITTFHRAPEHRVHPPGGGSMTRTARIEGRVQIAIMLLMGGGAGAASFKHIHDLAVHYGQPSWIGWANATVIELMSIVSGLEIRRGGESLNFALAQLRGRHRERYWPQHVLCKRSM